MRKRNYLMGLVAAMAVSIAVPAAAHAAIGTTTIAPVPKPTKQAKKKRGGIGLGFTTHTSHTADTILQPARNVVVDFDRDYKFNAGKIARCNPGLLAGATTEAAKAACSKSVVGTGSAILWNAARTQSASAVVTAFNGVPSGGSLALLLHTRVGPPVNNTLVLDGTLINSPLGGDYGKRLNVNIANSTPTGFQLETFFVNIPKKVSKKKKKKLRNGKKKVTKTFYMSAKCSNKSWQFSSTNQHYAGGATTNATADVRCKQQKKKKKKKKKKK